MSLLEINGLTHAFGDNVLFKNAEFTLNKGEHIGIVGQNGTGKSTFIKICTDQIIPDAGHVIWHPRITTGYLDQYAQIDSTQSMRAFLESAYTELYQMEKRMNELYAQAADGDMSKLMQAAQYQERLDREGFYLIEPHIEQVAEGLGLRAIGLERSVGQMSGGQRAKVILARLLLEKPDVLLLDEPTNFLDKEHIIWLSEYLVKLPNALMIVSHDYGFLEKVATGICDIDNQKIKKYYGTYSAFKQKKALLRADYIRQYHAQQSEIKRTEEFIRKNIAGRKAKMARGRQKQLDRLDKMEAIKQNEMKPYFCFEALPCTKMEQLRVSQLVVGYQKPVLSDLSFSITGREKVVIRGFNGIGKSTMLKTLAGQIKALQGGFNFTEQTVIGYFEQDMHWPDMTLSPLQIVSDSYPGLMAKDIRKYLACCGISGSHAIQAVKTLSGGEQAKVKLCLLALSPCNFLIMDEPTNHLDVQAKDSLKQALAEFAGTVLLVSHEEAFYKRWVQRVIDIGQ